MLEEPRGLLRLTCGVEFGMIPLGSWIEDFVARYRHVAVEVEYTSRDIDLVHEGFELAIRSGSLPDSRLAARPLGRFDYGRFASPAHLRDRGLPAEPGDLEQRDLVVFTEGTVKAGWSLRHPDNETTVAVKTSARDSTRCPRPSGLHAIRVAPGGCRDG